MSLSRLRPYWISHPRQSPVHPYYGFCWYILQFLSPDARSLDLPPRKFYNLKYILQFRSPDPRYTGSPTQGNLQFTHITDFVGIFYSFDLLIPDTLDLPPRKFFNLKYIFIKILKRVRNKKYLIIFLNF